MLSQGHLVEYIDNGRFTCAYVMENNGKRLRLLNQNSREVSLPESRIVISSSRASVPSGGREAMISALREAAEQRGRIALEIDLEEIWEAVVGEDDSIFKPDFLAELGLGGAVDDDHLAGFIRAVFKDRFFFRFKNERITVHSEEQVAQLRHQVEREAERDRLIKEGAKAIMAIMRGAEVGAAAWPDRDHCLAVIRDFYLKGGEALEADLARVLLKDAGLHRPHDPYYLMIRAGLWRPHENVQLLRAELPIEFSTEAQAQAEAIAVRAGEILAEPHRRDLRHLAVITIDGASTRDFDDGLHLRRLDDGGFEVGVHISDVAACVAPGTPLFHEAMERSTSLYFPDGQVPMLPESLSQGLCSLVEGRDRAAISFLHVLGPDGELRSSEIVASVIRVQRRLTYVEVDGLLDSDPDLALLERLRLELRNRRLNAGALMLPFPDVNVSVAANGEVRVCLAPVDTPARSIVSELMILANTVAARRIGNQGIPGLFRSQGPPRQRIVEGIEHDPRRLIQQRKQLSRGELTTKAKAHSGLGVECYTTITSPIRRFLDLVMQHQLAALLRGQGMLFGEEACRDFIGALHQNLGRANNVKQQRQRYWLLRYFENRVGGSVEALVVSRGPTRTGLLLTDCLLEVDLPTNPGAPVAVGDLVRVRIAKANALDNVLLVEW